MAIFKAAALYAILSVGVLKKVVLSKDNKNLVTLIKSFEQIPQFMTSQKPKTTKRLFENASSFGLLVAAIKAIP